jgi:hypothetical protein
MQLPPWQWTGVGLQFCQMIPRASFGRKSLFFKALRLI